MISKQLRFASTRLTLAFLLSGFMCSTAHAMDTVIMDRPQSVLDRRKDYTALLLQEVMEKTKSEYGPYTIVLAADYMERERQLQEMIRGTRVNVIANPSQPSWEANLIAIKVPVDMGLQSWRVGLINRKDQERFRAVQTREEFKHLYVGAGAQWASFAILRNNDFNVVPGINFDGLFKMLSQGRFDYFLLGVNEVFPELDGRADTIPDLALDDSFVVHLPLPWLFFVSPKTPRLAARISDGMEAMVKDGSLRQFMLNYHRKFLLRANLCNRRVFEVANANVSAEFLARQGVWFNPMDPKNGICPAKKLPMGSAK